MRERERGMKEREREKERERGIKEREVCERDKEIKR
jgi:hypothetical protein